MREHEPKKIIIAKRKIESFFVSIDPVKFSSKARKVFTKKFEEQSLNANQTYFNRKREPSYYFERMKERL